MRKPVYLAGLVGLLLSACSEAPASRTDAASGASSFAELVRIGRKAPGTGSSDRMSYADLKFHPAAVRYDVNRDGQITWAIFDTTKMDVVKKSDVQAAALAFVKAHEDVLKVDADELALNERGIVASEGELAFAFNRKVGDALVEGAFFQVVFVKKGDGYTLAELTNRSHGAVDGLRSNAANVEPDWVAVLGFEPTIASRKSVLFPTEKSGRVALVQAVKYELSNKDKSERYTVIADAATGALLQAVDSKQTIKVLAEVYERSYYYKNKLTTLPLSGVRVNGRSSGQDGSTTESGEMNISLSSSLVSISDQGQTVSFDLEPSDTDPVARPNSQVDMPSLNAFIAINRAIATAKRYLTTSEVQYFNSPISVLVNSAGSCNAFYDGNITLFAAGGGCANMGEINDVIYHEWGHGLDQFTGTQGGISDSAFSEGIGDTVAGFITGDPNMAPGFKVGSERGIRSSKNTARFPDDRGEAHSEGTIISGAFWDMREAFVARYGAGAGVEKSAKIFFRHLLTADTYQQSYRAALRLNDDDNNPATRSPDHCLITAAFAAHGLATEEQDCRDKNEPTVPKLDESLHLMIVDASGDQFDLAAAVDGDKKIAFCPDEVTACVQGTQNQDLSALSPKGSTKFFKTTGRVTLVERKAFTLLAKDAAGNVIGYRSFRVETP